MACGLALTAAASGKPEGGERAPERPATTPRTRHAHPTTERRDNTTARRAAHHAAAGFRRVERRRLPDRRMAQRREPYLGEVPPGAPADSGRAEPYRDDRSPAYAARRGPWWIVFWSGLVLIAAIASWVALNPAAWSQANDLFTRAARLAGLLENPQQREREGRFGTSPHELPYDGQPAAAEPVEVPPPAPEPPRSESSGGTEPSQAGAPADKPETGENAAPAPAVTAAPVEKPAEAPKPAPVVKPKPKPRPAAPQIPSTRKKELDRLRSQAYQEGT